MGIPISNIKNLMDVCHKLEIPVKLHVSTTYSNLSENDNIVTSLGISKLSVSITTSPVLPIGRAPKQIMKNDFISKKEISQLRCAYDGMCNIDWDGNVFWCCAMHNKYMVIGNIRTDNINSILNNFRKNKIFMCILSKGFPYLANIIEKNKIIPLKEYYVDGCDFCNSIFENISVIKQLEKIL